MIIEIPGKPQPKQRPRLGYGGKAYTPEPTQAFEKRVKHHAKMAGATPVSGPVHVDITSVFSMPKSLAKYRKAALDGQPHTNRPDLDNLVKSVLDGLNGVAFDDDAQVHSVSARKIWSADCGEGKTIVRITH